MAPTMVFPPCIAKRYADANQRCKMCRNIKTLFNFDPPVTSGEVRGASLQFVRKISGFNKPSRANGGHFWPPSMKSPTWQLAFSVRSKRMHRPRTEYKRLQKRRAARLSDSAVVFGPPPRIAIEDTELSESLRGTRVAGLPRWRFLPGRRKPATARRGPRYPVGLAR